MADPIKQFIDKPTEVERRMFGRIMERMSPYAKLFSLLALAWLWFSIAVYARWITLPEIPFLTDQQIATLGIVYNASWWGFIRPRILKMKEHHDMLKEQSDG